MDLQWTDNTPNFHKGYDQETEDKVATFVIERREHQLPVSRARVSRYVLSLTKSKYPDFKASSGWMTRFMDSKTTSV